MKSKVNLEALRMVAQALLPLQQRISEPLEEARAQAVALVGTVLMECSPESFAKHFAEASGRKHS